MHGRRRTLAAAAGLLTASGVAGRALTATRRPARRATATGERDVRTIDVSIFTVERLWRTPPGREGGPAYRARLAKAALERALPTLSDAALAIEADVSIVAEPVPDDAVDGDDADAALAAFREYVDGRADAAAAHSNLLIAHAPGAGATGAGQLPEAIQDRASGPTVAAIFDGLGLGQNGMDAATGHRSGSYGRTLSTLVHEVGHNLGLGHDDGDARRDADDASRVYVTPMRTGYRSGDADARPVYTPYFNPEIETRSLVLG